MMNFFCKEEVEARRDSNIVWIPVHLKLFYTFEQLKAIWEENLSIFLLQDNGLLPNNFAEHIYHVGNSQTPTLSFSLD